MSNCCVANRQNVSHKDEKQPSEPTLGKGIPENAIFVCGGESFVGTDKPVLVGDGEGPERPVVLNDFYLEAETVTNHRFADFVSATGYVTDSERYGSGAVFAGLMTRPEAATLTMEGTPWWAQVKGASWQQPEGPGSNLDGRQDHPVTQISWNDAINFARWVGGRLPTEAEWEHAARGGSRRRRFPWGDTEPMDDVILCNIWQGQFPEENTLADGYLGTAPARSFDPTDDGFFNLAGNVWEWTADPFRIHSMTFSAKQRNDQAQHNAEKVLKGGSYLCHIKSCYRYRIAARMGLSKHSASGNIGFRVAYDASTTQEDHRIG